MSAPPINWQEIADHRGRRNAELDRRVRFLEAERRRLERLLAVALEIAAGVDCDPLAMLEVTAALAGDEPGRPAFVLEEENVHFHGPQPPLIERVIPVAA